VIATPRTIGVFTLLAWLAAALLDAGPEGGEPVKVGVLKLSSSAPIFVGVEKGFFREFGSEPELVYFQAAGAIVTAVAARQIEVGATGLTAGFYNAVLGGEEMSIVADKGREWPGYPLVGLVVQKELHDAGLRSLLDLKGKRIGLTTLGSTLHYSLGNILEKAGLKLADVRVVPMQTLPATIEALKGRQVDAILLPQPFPGTAEAQGFGKILFWTGDLHPWQTAAVFYSKRFAGDRKRALAFMKGYVKASRYYYDAVLLQKDGRPAPGANYDESCASRPSTRRPAPRSSVWGFPSRTAMAGCSCPTSSGRCCGGPRTDS
jgi:NitT/TauT family transport system substrate-binding protein